MKPAVALLFVGLLAGCDKVPLTPKDALRMADPFGAATRELQSSEKGGDTYVYLVESRREGDWAGADLAIYRQHNGLCPEGQRPEIKERSPGLLSDSVAARHVSHPAGTTFRLVVLCPAQPYEEITFASGTSRRDAEKQVFEDLVKGEWQPGRLVFATSLPVTQWMQKYEWMNEVIGREVSRQLPLCSGGVIVRRVVIGNYAEGHQPGGAEDNRGEFVFGLLSDCADGLDPEIVAEWEASE